MTHAVVVYAELSPEAKPAGPRVRLRLPTTRDDGSVENWCLRACTSAQGWCKLPQPAFPASIRNVFFSRPCPQDRTSTWYSLAHSSGYVRWVNEATNLCLALKPGYSLTYGGTASPSALHDTLLPSAQVHSLPYA
jgi:hypothetical protein